MNIDWDRISAAMNRRRELATYPPDVLAGMVTDLQNALTKCWTPLTLRAELVRAGDVIVGRDGVPMLCTLDAWPLVGPKVTFEVQTGQDHPLARSYTVARDRTVTILVPHADRNALLELRRQLGARITDRVRTET